MSHHENEYILLCDESIKDGVFYSNFYGGILVGSSFFERMNTELNRLKHQLNLFNEVKWQRVTENYLSKYLALMDAFFSHLKAGHAKVRIMFRQSANQPVGLSRMQIDQTFYLLYYQFIKHAFGFSSMPPNPQTVHLRLYFDQFPDTGEQVARFKGFILGLNASREFKAANLNIRPDDFAEIRSHEHVILQCLDVVLGAMAFRLNDMHKLKPPGAKRRGSRTIAKEKLYNHILGLIKQMRPGFNIGISTGGGKSASWLDAYRHWSFVPNSNAFDQSKTKGK